ncbi:MAG: hypothetical protein QOI98_3469 [Solirubrobacteraceae bacterium]|jgi:hypothetical protein|nr:hypothetical protein [Solirubrobacteraceae bacterium]
MVTELPQTVLTALEGVSTMRRWIRRHSLAVWMIAAAAASNGVLQKFIHTADVIGGGGRHFT